MLRFWSILAAFLFFLSLLVHTSTFFFDPIARFPAVMLIHVAIFVPFGAAIYYTTTLPGSRQDQQDVITNHAPRPLALLAGAFFLYALVNFAIFMVLSEGGSATRRGDQYVLHSHGTVLRHLTEAEFHQHQAYVVRGFSGHWMAFSAAAWTFLTSIRNWRKLPRAGPPSSDEPSLAAKLFGDNKPSPHYPILRAAFFALVVYVPCVAMILTATPLLCAIAAIPIVIAAILAFRRRNRFPHAAPANALGCLSTIPNAFLAIFMGRYAIEFIYVALTAGLHAAITHSVSVSFPRSGPSQLSTGQPLNNRLWAALMIFVQFPLFALGIIGLTHLAEHIGRLLQLPWRRLFARLSTPSISRYAERGQG